MPRTSSGPSSRRAGSSRSHPAPRPVTGPRGGWISGPAGRVRTDLKIVWKESRGSQLSQHRASAGRLPDARLVVFPGLPRRALARAAAGQPDTAGAQGGGRAAARHHDRGRGLRRRGDPRRRPARHDGQRHRAARHGKGLPGRRVLGRRHRGHRGPGRGDGQALPAGAGALREDRGRHPVPGGQGQPALHDDQGQPEHGPAGPGRRPGLRRLGHRPGEGPDLLLRRHRRPQRGDRLRRHRLGLCLRPRHPQEALPPGPDGAPAVHRGDPGALRRGRRGLRHRRPRHRPAGLPADHRHDRGGLPPAARRRGRRARPGGHRRPSRASRRAAGTGAVTPGQPTPLRTVPAPTAERHG
ncbi:hypothetical protein SBRY_80100 [Actinacidiphila bryophytorum]|uniref:Uncharacterized protein n=1 Tax=Actinacidiphila bryophytorum TaxID=1436133 RepID=A0A9W4MKZ7_9ACTN|nr:hypothetical protein SBRY_80100 [Actinacidiphila bryophytorum]